MGEYDNVRFQMGSDDGYFPRSTSILRRVHEERAVGLFFGQRALCIGALAPLNYVGTSEHSNGKLTPFPPDQHKHLTFALLGWSHFHDLDFLPRF